MNVTDIPILSIIIFLPLVGSIVLAVLPVTAAQWKQLLKLEQR